MCASENNVKSIPHCDDIEDPVDDIEDPMDDIEDPVDDTVELPDVNKLSVY